MRQLTCEEILLLRSDQWSRYARHQEARRPKEKVDRRLRAGQRTKMIDALAPILRRAEPTPFVLEGPLRAHLRARLCLKGWGWKDADRAAEDVVGATLNRIGATRPSWKQGQPEYTQDGITVVQRMTCTNCGARLPDGHTKFCSPVCATNFHSRLSYMNKTYEAERLNEIEDSFARCVIR